MTSTAQQRRVRAAASRPVRVPARLAAALARASLRLLGLAVLVTGLGVLLAASAAPAVGWAHDAVVRVSDALLDVPPLPERFEEFAERSIVQARDGSTLAVLHDVENRKVVDLADVPLHVRQAVIATEDRDFYTHRGVNWAAVSRAVVGNVRAGEIESGASTITQQLVRNTILEDRSVTYRRKVREALLAVQLERRMPKDEILERYLNLAYFGNGIYGIGTAAEYYFGRPVGELNRVQAATLAGIIRSPIANDPVDHPEAALQRRNIVLGQMDVAGYIPAGKLAALQARPLKLRLPERLYRGESFFVTYVRELLKREPALGATVAERDRRVLRGGLTIRTTLNPDLHRLARRAIRKILTDADGPQASLVAVNPRNGQILAMGNGPRSFGEGEGRTKVTPAVQGLGSTFGRQPGSSFKAFTMVAALEAGIGPTFTYEAGSSYQFRRDCGTEDYELGNYADGNHGTLDMVSAIARSSNTYFAHLADRLGPQTIVETAQRMGIRSRLAGYCSTVLGTEEVYVLDMASAYGTLANKGAYCEPYAIMEVTDSRGRTILRRQPTCTEAVERDIATRATHLLRGPIEYGTAYNTAQIGRPAAGKTGTTDDYDDAWFAGFVPQLSAATWVGHPDANTTLYDGRCSGGRVTGGCLPTMIWAKFMRAATKDLKVRDFPNPPPIERATVPLVVGDTVETGRGRIDAARFTVITKTVKDGRPAGTVVRQDPKAGAFQDVGAEVVLYVSDGTGPPPTVPRLVGLTREEADSLLRELGLAAEAFEVKVRKPSLVGRVVAQFPSAGSPLDEDTTMRVHIGR